MPVFLLQNIVLLIVCLYVSVCGYVHMSSVPLEDGGGHWILELGMNSARAASALNC